MAFQYRHGSKVYRPTSTIDENFQAEYASHRTRPWRLYAKEVDLGRTFEFKTKQQMLDFVDEFYRIRGVLKNNEDLLHEFRLFYEQYRLDAKLARTNEEKARSLLMQLAVTIKRDETVRDLVGGVIEKKQATLLGMPAGRILTKVRKQISD